MKKFLVLRSLAAVAVSTATLLCLAPAVHAAVETPISNMPTAGTKVGVINFKKVVDESKYGKAEQANFEELKKQMEAVLEEKEKSLTELASKFEDADYVDSLSPEAENELKHKFRTLNQELTQIQGQYYQVLNQTNMKILQKLSDLVSSAAQNVAKENKIDLILSDESGFYFTPSLDFSRQIITLLDEMYQKEAKETPKQSSN
jgi:outer membrane protein